MYVKDDHADNSERRRKYEENISKILNQKQNLKKSKYEKKY